MTSSSRLTLRIATRSSALALWQANHVAARIAEVAPDVTTEIIHVTTTGDRDQSGSLRSFGGLGVFTREVQKAVLEGRADLAVHSLKDLPTDSTPGLVIAAVPPREETADALVLPSGTTGDFELSALPQGAKIGTGSLRRRAQLLHLRPDLVLEEARGNVDTRLRKLDGGEFHALILAAAGLKRLGLESRISQRLMPPTMYAAVGQGALGIECREGDVLTLEVLSGLDDRPTHVRATAERSLLNRLRAGCHAPVGVETRIDNAGLHLEGIVLSPDGRQRLVAKGDRADADAVALGNQVADRLLELGAAALIRG